MDNGTKYKIKKADNRYRIFVETKLVERQKMGWWWRFKPTVYKEFDICKRADDNGNPVSYSLNHDGSVRVPPCHHFDTLEQAVDQIKLWKTPPVYFDEFGTLI